MVVDVRVPSRALTISERSEIVIRLRKNQGSFDFNKLIGNFQNVDLLAWGFNESELISAGLTAPDFPEYGTTAADGVEICICKTCGNQHAKAKPKAKKK